MNKGWILFLVALCYAGYDPSDKYTEDGPLLQGLTEYVEFEFDGLKKALDKEYSLTFNWEFCSMASFPMLLGKRCPYFPDIGKYRSIHWRGSTAYLQDETHIYVGIKYWFCIKNGNPSDTCTYQVISYRLNSSHLWIRDKEIITIHTNLGTIFKITGEEL
jgi:hypothetical protein